MSAPPTESKPAAAPQKRAPTAGPTVPAAAKKKGTQTVSFLPTLPGTAPKAPFIPTKPVGGPPKGAPQKGTVRPPGAPPGMRRPGGPPGAFQGTKPMAYPPRHAPQWVPVGAASSSVSIAPKEEQSVQEQPKRKEPQFTEAAIAPTAQSMAINPLNPSHPMTLPFLDPIKANPTLLAAGVEAESKTTTTQHTPVPGAAPPSTSVRAMGSEYERVNPANVMFRNEDGEYSGEDQVFFIQMPSALPIGPQSFRPSPLQEQAEILGFKGTLSPLPSGEIGKLLIYKSGKVKMKIGDVLFDVSSGMPCNFLQEVVAINTEKRKYYQLGDVTRRMVCYPDVESLLDTNSTLAKKDESSMDL